MKTFIPTRRNRVIIAAIIGLVTGLACYFIQVRFERGGGDFGFGPLLFIDLIHGINPYRFPPSIVPMPYPLPTALIVAPFALLPPEVAAGVFFGLSSALLVLALTRRAWWPLLTLLALPYWQSLLTVQWSPLFLAVALYPALLPLTLCKPTIGFPIAMTRMTRRRFVACAILGLVSLIIMPDWPIKWLGHQAAPGEYIPPLFTLPFGPLLLLALLRWKNQRAWFLLLLAAMPQRLWYDMLLVFLVAQTPRQIMVLAGGTWLAFGLWLVWLPTLSATLAVALVYLPALTFVLRTRAKARPDRQLTKSTA